MYMQFMKSRISRRSLYQVLQVTCYVLMCKGSSDEIIITVPSYTEKKVMACLLLLHTHNNIQQLQTCDISGIALYCANLLFIEEETYYSQVTQNGNMQTRVHGQ